jgi:hypothetical protein
MSSKRVVSLTEQTAMALLKNAGIVAKSSALETYAAQAKSIKGCNCNSKNAAKRRDIVSGVKSVIAASTDVQEAVKVFLKADVVKMYVGKTLLEF